MFMILLSMTLNLLLTAGTNLDTTELGKSYMLSNTVPVLFVQANCLEKKGLFFLSPFT